MTKHPIIENGQINYGKIAIDKNIIAIEKAKMLSVIGKSIHNVLGKGKNEYQIVFFSCYGKKLYTEAEKQENRHMHR